MRTLQRNKRTLYYALYSGVQEATDSDGNYTGEYEVSYATPVKARMNFSGGKGKAEIDIFGVENPFTHTVVTDDLTTAFDTDTIWWIGVSSSGPHNFRTTGISRTINQVVIALAEVDVENGADASNDNSNASENNSTEVNDGDGNAENNP